MIKLKLSKTHMRAYSMPVIYSLNHLFCNHWVVEFNCQCSNGPDHITKIAGMFTW